MKSKNKLIILGMLVAVLFGLSSINAFSAAVTWDGGAGTSNWNDALNWSNDAVPTDVDDVTLDNSSVAGAYTVNVNTNGDVNSLIVNGADIVLRPDASNARTMRIRDFARLSNGSILYTNAGGTGRLSWTFDGAGAINTIENLRADADATKLQFHNVTISSAITTPAAAGDGNFEIYGNLAINGTLIPSATATHSHIYFKGTGGTITNNGSLELNTVTFDNNSSYTTNTDMTINGDLTVASGSSFVVNSAAIVTLDGTDKTLTNNGTLTFNSGSSLNIEANTTLVGDLANFAGDLNVGASSLLKVTATNSISGTGSITTSAGSTINVNDGDGVAGAIDLATYSFNAATNYVIEGGSTGFSAASITTIGALTFGPAVDPNAVLGITITEGFSMSGALTVNNNTNTTTVTATSGTITMTGSVALTTSGEVIDFYGLLIDGGTVTVTDGQGIIVNNYLGVATGHVLDFVNSGGLYDAITFDGTATIDVVDATTGLLVDDNAEIEITGNVTFANNLTLPATLGTDGGVNIGASALVDFSTFVLTVQGAAGNITTAAGATLRTSNANGIAGSIESTPASVLDNGTNYEFYGTAVDFGFDAIDVAGTDIITVNDITINGAAIAETGDAADVDVTVNGDLTVTTGSLILPSAATGIIIMGTTGDANIVNTTNDEDALVFNILQIGGANTVTVSGDISIARAGGIGLDMNAAGTLDFTTNDATVHFVGATCDIANTNAGTYNFHHVVIENVTTINANVTSGLNIAGDLTITAPGTLTATALSLVTFNGTTQQTIETNGQALSLDLVTIDATADVITNDNMTLSSGTGAITIDGSFVASAGTVTTAGASSALTVSGNSATFFNLAAGAGTAATGNLSIIKTLSGTAYTQTSDDLTFLGDPADLDATPITNDGKQIANSTVTTLTIAGTLVVDSNCEFQTALAIAGAGTVDVNGRLELTATAAVFAGGTLDFSGGTVHLSGVNTADLGTGTLATTVTAGSTANAIIDGDQTTVVGGAITLNNLTLSSTAAIALEATDDITIHGTIVNDGLDMGASNAASQIALAGASASISGDIVTGLFVIDATATGATGDADMEVTGGAGAVTVTAGGAFTATGSLNLNGAGATILNGSDADDLVLHDVTVTQAASSAADFYIGGGLTSSNAVAFTHSGEIFFSGTGETITTNADNLIILNDVTFNGSYGLAAGATNVIQIAGDLEVTNTGSFDMNSLGVINFTGTQAIINNGTLVFNGVNNTAGALTTTSSFAVEGNFTNAGTFAATGSSIIEFDGTTALTGTATAGDTQFNAVTVDGDVTLVNDITLTGDLLVNGTFVRTTAADDEVVFAGATDKQIQNNGTLTFGPLTIANVAGNNISTSSDFNISGNFTIGGATGGRFQATAGTVTFNGGATQNLDNATGVTTNARFYGMTLTGASTELEATTGSNFTVNGPLTVENDALLDCHANDVRLTFNGSGQQDITLNSTGTLGTSGRAFLHNVTLNNADGLRLVGSGGDIMIGQLDLDATMNFTNGDVDLNGNNIFTVNLTAGAPKEGLGKLNEGAGNTVVNNGPETSTGHVYATVTPVGNLSTNNLGGLGAYITATAPGATTVKRYHIPLTVGSEQQASRYYSITTANANLDGKLAFSYDQSELGILNEDNLILVYGDDPAVDIWTIQESTLDKSIRRLTTPNEAIDQFSGQTEWWTIGTPDVLSATAITNGLASSPISAGTQNNAIFGAQYTSNGQVDLSTVRFNLGRNLAATNEVEKWKLVYSEDENYTTSEDNNVLIDVAPGGANTTGGQSGDNYIQFDLTSVNDTYKRVNEGTPINLFLVVDVISSVTTNTATITPTTTNLLTTITDGVSEEFTLTGSNYSFRAAVMVSPNEIGLTNSPLVPGQDNVALFGFKATVTNATSSPGITGFKINFDQDPSEIFENVRVYQSNSEHDFRNMGVAELVTLTTNDITSTQFSVAFNKINIGTTPRFFFVVADVKNGVTNTTNDITPSLVYSNITSTELGIRGTDIDGNAADSHTGFLYSFVNSTVTMNADNNPAASNLGTRVDRQPVFGFTLSPDNSQSTEFTGVNFTVTLSSANETANLSNWGLYYDSNENGYPENSEKVANGTLTSATGVGNLQFTGFTQNLTDARKYLVGVKVGSNATAGNKISVQLTSQDYVTLTSPAKLNAAGPLPATAVEHTIRTAGTATAFEIAHHNSSVVTGNTLGFTVRAVDADGYPTNVSANQSVSIAFVSGVGTVGANTATIANGTNNVILSPVITAAGGSTNLVVNATGGLTASANTSAIKVLEAEPAANDAVVSIANITATSARITNITANSGATDGRIVVIRQGAAPHAPTDGTPYTPNLNIADGLGVGVGQTGAGSYVVMANVAPGAAAFSNDITGLMPNTRYYVQVFDYNGTTPNFNYATGSVYTSLTSRNPISFTTSTGDITSGTSESAPANIQTDIDVNSTITTTGGVNWFRFNVNSQKRNIIIRISDLPANYDVELYDAITGLSTKTLLRDSKVLSTGDEVIILNQAPVGTYVLKVSGANEDAYSSSSYKIRVSTSANEIFSQVE